MRNAQKRPREFKLTKARVGGLLLSVLFLSIFTNLLMLVSPMYMLQVYDRVLTSRSEATLLVLTGLVAALYFFMFLIEFARGRVMARAGARFKATFDERVFARTIERTATNQRYRSTALNDLDAIKGAFISPVALAVFDMPWSPLFLAAIFFLHPWLGYLALSGGIISILITVLNQFLTSRKTSAAGLEAMAAGRFAGMTESASAYIHAQGMSDSMRDRWLKLSDTATLKDIGAADWTGWFASFTKAFRMFLQSAILGLGAYLVIQHEMTSGGMIAASILMGRTLAPIDQALGQWPLVQRAFTSYRTLKEFFSFEDAAEPETALPRPEARLEVKNYTVMTEFGRPPLLAQVNLLLEPGHALGVIGSSGAGKTTLARALVGLHRGMTGEITLGGASISQYTNKVKGELIGYLPQEPDIYAGTVAENIARMEVEPDFDRVIAAAKKARVHDLIVSLPKGYDTPVGPGGLPLSGGQKQRVALARALYSDPILLVLDEPNSALDNVGTEALAGVIGDMKADGKAVVIMTHHPSAMFACDQLMVLDGGHVRVQGPRDEVAKALMSAMKTQTDQGNPMRLSDG